MPYINKIDINGVVYTLENLTDGNNIVALPELSRDDIFVLRGNIVDNTSSTSALQPLSARQGKLLRDDLNAEIQNRTNDVNLEEQRATDAERVLTENLNKEIDRAKKAEAEKANASAISELTTKYDTALSKKVDKVDDKGLSSNDYTDDEKTKLSGIASGANKYVHPTYGQHESGLYKITVDGSGHVSAVADVSKSDIVTLGLPAQDTTYGIATDNIDGLLSANDKKKYDEYDERISALVGTFEEPVDYIVEQGKSGSWTYRKWNSGVSECWGTVTGTLAPSEAASGMTGLRVFSGSVTFPADLFVDAPSVTYNCRIGDGYSFPADAETSTITHFNWTALSTVGTGYSECAIAAKASGVWK